MPKTKKELVADILSIEKVDTNANLMKLTLKELEGILSDLEQKSSEEVVQEEVAKEVVPQVDMTALMEQMKAEMMAELKEQARKEIQEEMATESVVKEQPVVRKKVEIDRYASIPVMNISNGKLIYTSKKSGAEYVFSKMGDVEYIEYQELLTMRSSQRRFLDEPFIVILDEDVVNALGLTKQYESFQFINDGELDQVFRIRFDEFKALLETSPIGIKHSIVSRARELYKEGKLDSVRVVNYLNDRFDAEIGQRG